MTPILPDGPVAPVQPAAGCPGGRVALVGAGPGDVELLTRKAARLLAEADWLVHDALVHSDVLALAPQARHIPVGKRAGNPSARQSAINQILLDCARRGGLTVRLKGGDPLIFARAQEELDVLRAAGVAVEVVPGISAAQAAYAALGLPMTERGQRRALVLATPQVHAPDQRNTAVMPGTAATEMQGNLLQALRPVPAPRREALRVADIVADPMLRRWAEAIVAAGSGTLYMAASVADQVRETLLALGMPGETGTLWIADISLPGQVIIPGRLDKLRPPPDSLRGKPVLLLLGLSDAQTRLLSQTGPAAHPA
ncbi:MAG: SAM-dependent methyltransferase [Lautropia sp.]|nr:SAM-dependent methyltransferase [Lautropia sp.]